MEIITVRLGESAELGALSANAAATLVQRLTEDFTVAASNHIDRLRERTRSGDPTTARAGSSLPAMTSTPKCIGCGFEVVPPATLCATCKEKPQFAAPRGTIEVGTQPEPAYKGAPAQVSTL